MVASNAIFMFNFEVNKAFSIFGTTLVIGSLIGNVDGDRYNTLSFVDIVALNKLLRNRHKGLALANKFAAFKDFFIPHPDTLHAVHVHPVFREKWIETGYRPPYRHLSYYLKSILTFHNETFNIWSHLIGALVMGYYTLIYSESYTRYNQPVILAFGICCVCGQLMSVFAHWFCSISPNCYRRIFLFDYAGIGLFSFANHLVLTCCSYDARYVRFLGPYAIPLAIFIGASVACSLCISRIFYRSIAVKNILNFIPNTLSAALGFIPVIMRIHHELTTREARDSTHHDHQNNICNLLAIHCCLFAVMGFFFMSHIPERLTRLYGRFDVIGHSHQLFHISVTLCFLTSMKAAFMDIKFGYRTQEELYILEKFCSIWSAVVIAFIINICVMCACVRHVNVQKYEGESLTESRLVRDGLETQSKTE
ncbi:membrane progestin receptor beta-like [Lineus longissimus]|uniref:membrane progestin receptor beta-like n=1 Tax=Lineus longissimus TaxID=88925 RepID=UPI00315D1431